MLRKIKITDLMMVAGVVLIAIGVGSVVRGTKSEPTVVKKAATPTLRAKLSPVKVDVEGEVVAAGVYELEGGARVIEALSKAGGLGLRADREWVEKNLNRAKVLTDGEKIYIPAKGEVLGVGGSEGSSSGKTQKSDGLISINTAEAGELDDLPGVGPALAQRIIDYRLKNAGFRNIEEIKLVSGIGDKLFEKIKDKIGL